MRDNQLIVEPIVKRVRGLSDGGNIVLGVMLVIASSLLFAIGGAATKGLSTSVPPASALIWRSLISSVIIAAWFAAVGWPRIRSTRMDLHIARGLATFAGLWTYFGALALIPLSSAVLLRTAAPVFVPVVAYGLYRRRSDRFVWIGAWIGLVGIAMLVKPTSFGVGLGELLGVASGVLGAVGAVLIWRLASVDDVATQLLWVTLVGAVSSAIVAPWYLTRPELSDWLLVFVMAVTTLASQIVLAYAFKVAPADKTITWGYLSVIFGGLFGAIYWSETPTMMAMFGMVIVVLGSHIASIRRRTST